MKRILKHIQARLAEKLGITRGNLNAIIKKDKGTKEFRRKEIFQALQAELKNQDVLFPIPDYEHFLAFGRILRAGYSPDEALMALAIMPSADALLHTPAREAERRRQQQNQGAASAAILWPFLMQFADYLINRCGDNVEMAFAYIRHLTNAVDGYAHWQDMQIKPLCLAEPKTEMET